MPILEGRVGTSPLRADVEHAESICPHRCETRAANWAGMPPPQSSGDTILNSRRKESEWLVPPVGRVEDGRPGGQSYSPAASRIAARSSVPRYMPSRSSESSTSRTNSEPASKPAALAQDQARGTYQGKAQCRSGPPSPPLIQHDFDLIAARLQVQR